MVSDPEGMVEILCHRRETRRQTEKTNVDLKPWIKTETREIASDRHAEVSRGHSRYYAGEASEALLYRKVENGYAEP